MPPPPAEEANVPAATLEDLAALAMRTVATVAEALARFELLLTQNEHKFNDHEQSRTTRS